MKTIRFLIVAGGRKSVVALLWLAMISIGSAQPFLPVAAPPVRIISPPNRAVFHAPVDVPIFAYAGRIVPELIPGGALVTNVDFYAGTNFLGRGVNLGSSAFPPTPFFNYVLWRPVPRLSSLYLLVWSNAVPGDYALTAVAKAAGAMSRTSAPVNITILASSTNTNPTDVVSIVATDPIAIAGTNACVWMGLTNTAPAWTNWWTNIVWHPFTNWGPKSALFTVRRFGDASSNLTVNYNVGGTASNGVDYVTLPGSVTVPAGRAFALIPIVPIETSSNSLPKTVILALTPDTNRPPDYLVGNPRRAEALILEDWPRPSSFVLPDRSFHFNGAGPDGAWFSMQYSTDFVNWSTICTNQVFQGAIDFVDPDAPDNSSRFYRALPLSGTPAN
jgi:hypothetical protein